MCSFSSPGDGAGPCHTAEHPSAGRVVCADSGPKPLGPRARRHRASQLTNGRRSRRRASCVFVTRLDSRGRRFGRTGTGPVVLWRPYHAGGPEPARPRQRPRSNPPPAAFHTPQTDPPHGRRGSEGALPRSTPLEAGCNERSTYIHPQGTVVTARYAQNALLWPGTRQTAANSQQRPSGGPLTATARAAILLVLRSNPRGTNPSLV